MLAWSSLCRDDDDDRVDALSPVLRSVMPQQSSYFYDWSFRFEFVMIDRRRQIARRISGCCCVVKLFRPCRSCDVSEGVGCVRSGDQRVERFVPDADRVQWLRRAATEERTIHNCHGESSRNTITTLSSPTVAADVPQQFPGGYLFSVCRRNRLINRQPLPGFS